MPRQCRGAGGGDAALPGASVLDSQTKLGVTRVWEGRSWLSGEEREVGGWRVHVSVIPAVEEHGRCPVGFQWSWNKGQAAGAGTSRKGTGRGRLILLQYDPDRVSPYGAGTQ